jgi:tetratricopeptide (TPR) repeat protein
MGTPSPVWAVACGAVIDNAQAPAADRAKAMKNRGILFVRQTQFELAIKDFSGAIAINPSDAEAYNDRALAYQMNGDRDRALPDYDKAIALDPKFTLAYFNRGIARAAGGDSAGAIADYTQAATLKPDFGPAYRSRGIAKRQAGDLDGAIADQTLAFKNDSNDAEALNLRGAALMAKGELDPAIADFGAVMRLRPNNADAYNNRGAALSQKGELTRAAADYDRALLIAPDLAGGYSNRGNVRFALGNFGGAADDLERAAKGDPKNSYAALWRYLAIARAGNTSTVELGNAARAFDASKWPAPVVAFYLGKTNADAVRAAAAQGDAQTRIGQQCEAEFYIGEFMLAQGSGKVTVDQNNPGQSDLKSRIDPAALRAAKPVLSRAAEICPAGFTERMGAIGELKRMQ